MRARNIESTFHQEATLFSDSFNEEREEVKPIKASSYHKYYHPDEQSGICVVRRKGESDEELIKRFRKKFSKSGLSKELRDRMYYEKPCNKRRRKKMQSIRLMQKEAQKLQEMQEQFDKFKSKEQYNKRKENNRNDSSTSRQNYRRSYDSRKN